MPNGSSIKLLMTVVLAFVPALAFAAEPMKAFHCRRVQGTITIDGKLDEAAWKNAELIDQFSLPWLQENPRPPKTQTKARLLWDDEAIYFSAELEDSDLYADITEHDGETWYNDVFELFFKPNVDKPGYYEFQVNAAGTVMDMFLPRRGAGGFRRFIGERDFHIEAKVQHQGTLNHWQDTDKGWTVEGKIPWKDFEVTGGKPQAGDQWKFALCRYDYSVAFEGPDLSTCAPLSSKRNPDFHHHEDYATLIFKGENVAADFPVQETYPVAVFKEQSDQHTFDIDNWSPVTTSRIKGSPEPPLPYTTKRIFPKLQIDFPVHMLTEPGSGRLYFLDQPKPYGKTRLCRTKGNPANGEIEVLLEWDKAVAYSLCFHPDYEKNGFLYVGANAAWEKDQPKTCRVIRYTIGREAPHTLEAESAKTILEWESDGHNGAAITFGLDGMMYVTTGDGTSDSDDNLTGQGLDHLLAKVLRIDVDHPTNGKAYSVPKDNPFVGQKNIVPETWCYGLRNPWRITTDPQTGHIWVGNNGQDLWEQAYLIQKGANYGWSVYEGSHPFYLNRKLGPHPVSKPTAEHPHSEARSLTGGVVYHGKKLPKLRGAYIYGDHSTGKIWGIKHDGEKVIWHEELTDTPFNITAFALDAEGELMIADHRGNKEGGFYTLIPNDKPSYDPKDFPRKLSDSGLFRSVKDHQMQQGLIPYSVNSPLWSDGAHKARFIALPPTMEKDGKQQPATIEYKGKWGWNFPDNTVLVKSFGLELKEGDPSSRRWIETRFLTKQQGEWVGYSYAWNADQTDGVLVEHEGRDQKFSIQTADGETRTQAWHYPSRTECMVCHSRAANFVLGLSTAQMNKIHDYGQSEANQLDVLEKIGVLKVTKKKDEKLPKLANPYDETAELDARARSYLHVNCAVCHVKAGGGNAQMELDYTATRDKMNVVDVKPLHHQFNIKDARLIAPGDPDRSVLLHRVSIREQGQMPQLATARVDEPAIAMLRKWILTLRKEEE